MTSTVAGSKLDRCWTFFVFGQLIFNILFTQCSGSSAFRKTMVQAVSLKCGNRKWPSFWGAHCSHRTVSLERSDVLIYIKSEISDVSLEIYSSFDRGGLNWQRWFTTCVSHLNVSPRNDSIVPDLPSFSKIIIMADVRDREREMSLCSSRSSWKVS